MRNVFVIGNDPFNLETMQGLREARRYDFQALLPTSSVLKADSYDFHQLVGDADEELRQFGQTVDGIVTWWDFPSSALIPVVTELWDLYGPDLRSVLTLEHKYWSRLIQRAVAPEHVPSFAAFDPFSDDALSQVLDAGLTYPFWVKPVKSVASYLGFLVEGPEDFAEALEIIRAEVSKYGDPFEQALERVHDLPHEIEWLGGNACLAEGIIGGWQCTVEGFVSFGDVTVYGTVDSIREEGVSTFRAYHYPSQLPTPIQRRMAQIAGEVVTAAGLNHSCFNAEFFYDTEQGELWFLEVNVRLSQSHCDLFAKVDGASSQRAMIDLAQGRTPRMPYRLGDFPVAAKYFLRTTVDDGIVRSVPSEDDIAAVAERFPGTRIEIAVSVGTRLSDLPVQETYSWELGRIFFGADSHDALESTFAEIESMLPFEIEPVEGGS
ncbi:MAG: ATP-grasp domain-containing protein [Acidimicrobiales bacterium]|nr:ATP-grasp domain-containing protein [Acidimicrobiales bacterium]